MATRTRRGASSSRRAIQRANSFPTSTRNFLLGGQRSGGKGGSGSSGG